MSQCNWSCPRSVSIRRSTTSRTTHTRTYPIISFKIASRQPATPAPEDVSLPSLILNHCTTNRDYGGSSSRLLSGSIRNRISPPSRLALPRNLPRPAHHITTHPCTSRRRTVRILRPAHLPGGRWTLKKPRCCTAFNSSSVCCRSSTCLAIPSGKVGRDQRSGTKCRTSGTRCPCKKEEKIFWL